MRVVQAIAQIMKQEGVEFLIAYPLNPLIEACADADIRTIIVRQERTGIHMADAYSRMRSGKHVGVFCMQGGPGTENAFGAVAQAYSESVPLIVIPGGSARGGAWVKPSFNAAVNYPHITKWGETVNSPQAIVATMRRAFTQARNGRPGPVLVEVPGDVWQEEIGDFEYTPVKRFQYEPDSSAVEDAIDVLLKQNAPSSTSVRACTTPRPGTS